MDTSDNGIDRSVLRTLTGTVTKRWRRLQDEWQNVKAEATLEWGRRQMYSMLCRRHASSVQQLDELRERRKLDGSTILCVGNGPSLRTFPIEDLDQFPLLLTNHAARVLARRPAELLGTVMTDDYRLIEATPHLPAWARPLFVSSHIGREGNCPAAAQIVRDAEYAFRPSIRWVEGRIKIPGLTFVIEGNYDPGFATDLRRSSLFLNRSVIFSAMQLAVRLGARRIILIAVEMDYSGPHLHCVPGVKEIVPGFDYERMARPSFELTRTACDSLGVEILNATPGGRVEVFPRVALCDLAAARRAA